MLIESGKSASIHLGVMEYTLTPTLSANDQVMIEAVMTQHTADQVKVISRSTIVTKLGQDAWLETEHFRINMCPTLALRRTELSEK